MSVMLIDGNAMGYAANDAPRLTVGTYQVQAVFGMLRSVRTLLEKHSSKTPIVLWDSRAQWRFDLHPAYKSNRDKDPKQAAMREIYKRQKPDIMRGLQLLGVRQLTVHGYEADDTAGYLSQQYSDAGKDVMLITRDKDWLQLVRPGVSWHNWNDDVTVNDRTFEEFTGFKTPQGFVAGKALQGDTSDVIPGVGGLGETAAPFILHHYPSVPQLISEIRKTDEKTWQPPTDLKRYRKKLLDFAYNRTGGIDTYKRNIKLMNLLSVPKPDPAQVIMLRKPLDKDGFIAFAEELNFRSILNKLDQWLRPFEGK